MSHSEELRAYCDESGKAEDPKCKVISLAGFMAPRHDWRAFEEAWKAALIRHRVPFLHMRLLDKRRGPYNKWCDEQVKALLSDLIGVIQRSQLLGQACAFIADDLSRAAEEHSIRVNHYAFSLYVLACQFSMLCSNRPFQMILDKIDKGRPKADIAHKYFENDRYMSWRNWPTIIPISKNSAESSDDMPALQAADLAAWEARKSIELKLEWFSQVKPGLERKELDRSVIEWQAKQKKVTKIDAETAPFVRDRTSFALLFRNRRLDVSQWDYSQLAELFRNRRDGPQPAIEMKSTGEIGFRFGNGFFGIKPVGDED